MDGHVYFITEVMRKRQPMQIWAEGKSSNMEDVFMDCRLSV